MPFCVYWELEIRRSHSCDSKYTQQISVNPSSFQVCSIRNIWYPAARDFPQRKVGISKIYIVLCTDLKFTKEMLGLNACSSIYACAWCKCPSLHYMYSQIHLDYDTRTIQDMESFPMKIQSKTCEPYGCVHPPILLTIPINHYIPDPLHIYLHIPD